MGSRQALSFPCVWSSPRANNRSLREGLRAINASFATGNVIPNLPQALHDSTQALSYRVLPVDETTSQRVHEELAGIYSKHVAENTAKTSAFLQVLDLFRAHLVGEGQKLYWYNTVIHPILDNVGRLRIEISRAGRFMLGILDYDPDEDTALQRAQESSFFTRLLLEGYLARTGHKAGDESDYTWENEHIASQYEHILIGFGKQKPRDLMVALDDLIVDREHRAQALGLLTVLVRDQPPHLHQVSQTPLIEHLLLSLMIDTSTTVVQLALTALVMFLPHVPSSVQAHLPRLFLIYSRLLCWDQLLKIEPEQNQSGRGDQVIEAAPEWQKLYCAPDGEETTSLDMIHYFTFLYGLYPINFTSFIRKPRRYLKDIKFPRAEQLDLDQELIKARTEPFRQRHLLHPNFYSLTAEDELEEDRFLSNDASDVVAQCIGLVNNVPAVQNTSSSLSNEKLAGPSSRKFESKESIVDELPQVEDTASTNAESVPSISENLPLLASQRPVNNLAIQTGFGPQRENRRRQVSSPPLMAALENKVTPAPSSSEAPRQPAPGQPVQQAELQRLILILRNDLNYERYLKQQHLTHIGQLQRRHVADATLSASAENLMTLNKSLKSKLSKANDAYTALKKETATGRAQSKEFEVKLSSRVRALRDAEKDWLREREAMQYESDRVKRDNESLRKLVVESESRELLSTQKLATMEFALEKTKDTQKQCDDLEAQVRSFETRAWSFEQAADKHENTRIDYETLKMQLQSQQGQAERMRQAYEKRVKALEDTQPREETIRDRPEVNELIKQANRAVTAQYARLKEECLALQHDSMELKSQFQNTENYRVLGIQGTSSDRLRVASPSPLHSGGRNDNGFDESPGAATSSARLTGDVDEVENEPVESASAPIKSATSLLGDDSQARVASQTNDEIDHESSRLHQHRKGAIGAESPDGSTAGSSGRSNRPGAKSGSPSQQRQTASAVASKDGEKDRKKKKAQPKSGGIRGIRGLM